MYLYTLYTIISLIPDISERGVGQYNVYTENKEKEVKFIVLGDSRG